MSEQEKEQKCLPPKLCSPVDKLLKRPIFEWRYKSIKPKTTCRFKGFYKDQSPKSKTPLKSQSVVHERTVCTITVYSCQGDV